MSAYTVVCLYDYMATLGWVDLYGAEKPTKGYCDTGSMGHEFRASQFFKIGFFFKKCLR